MLSISKISVLLDSSFLFLAFKRPIYTTENFLHGSGKYGTRSKKIGSARINFTV